METLKLESLKHEILKHGDMESWKQGITINHKESHVPPVAHGCMDVWKHGIK